MAKTADGALPAGANRSSTSSGTMGTEGAALGAARALEASGATVARAGALAGGVGSFVGATAVVPHAIVSAQPTVKTPPHDPITLPDIRPIVAAGPRIS